MIDNIDEKILIIILRFCNDIFQNHDQLYYQYLSVPIKLLITSLFNMILTLINRLHRKKIIHVNNLD